jgi:hypothetical protein
VVCGAFYFRRIKSILDDEMEESPLDLMNGAIAWEGAVSVEVTAEGVHPWRLPWRELELFHPGVVSRAASPSGVRMTFLSDTTQLRLEVMPGKTGQWFGDDWTWDVLADGKLMQRVTQKCDQSIVSFDWSGKDGGASGKPRLVELYLPSQYLPVKVKKAWIGRSATAKRWTDERARFVAYGSSITHAKEAAGPSETWAAIVARRCDMHLTNLGFGGNEHLEPSIARVISDLPAAGIMLCVGGNVWGVASMSERTYRGAVIGMVEIIRAKKPMTPMVVFSCVRLPAEEDKPNVLGLKLSDYRQMTREATELLQRRGDSHLHFFNGLELFGGESDPYDVDRVHPDAQGQRLIAQRFEERVMPLIRPRS